MVGPNSLRTATRVGLFQQLQSPVRRCASSAAATNARRAIGENASPLRARKQASMAARRHLRPAIPSSGSARRGSRQLHKFVARVPAQPDHHRPSKSRVGNCVHRAPPHRHRNSSDDGSTSSQAEPSSPHPAPNLSRPVPLGARRVTSEVCGRDARRRPHVTQRQQQRSAFGKRILRLSGESRTPQAGRASMISREGITSWQ